MTTDKFRDLIRRSIMQLTEEECVELLGKETEKLGFTPACSASESSPPPSA